MVLILEPPAFGEHHIGDSAPALFMWQSAGITSLVERFFSKDAWVDNTPPPLPKHTLTDTPSPVQLPKRVVAETREMLVPKCIPLTAASSPLLKPIEPHTPPRVWLSIGERTIETPKLLSRDDRHEATLLLLRAPKCFAQETTLPTPELVTCDHVLEKTTKKRRFSVHEVENGISAINMALGQLDQRSQACLQLLKIITCYSLGPMETHRHAFQKEAARIIEGELRELRVQQEQRVFHLEAMIAESKSELEDLVLLEQQGKTTVHVKQKMVNSQKDTTTHATVDAQEFHSAPELEKLERIMCKRKMGLQQTDAKVGVMEEKDGHGQATLVLPPLMETSQADMHPLEGSERVSRDKQDLVGNLELELQTAKANITRLGTDVSHTYRWLQTHVLPGYHAPHITEAHSIKYEPAVQSRLAIIFRCIRNDNVWSRECTDLLISCAWGGLGPAHPDRSSSQIEAIQLVRQALIGKEIQLQQEVSELLPQIAYEAEHIYLQHWLQEAGSVIDREVSEKEAAQSIAAGIVKAKDAALNEHVAKKQGLQHEICRVRKELLTTQSKLNGATRKRLELDDRFRDFVNLRDHGVSSHKSKQVFGLLESFLKSACCEGCVLASLSKAVSHRSCDRGVFCMESLDAVNQFLLALKPELAQEEEHCKVSLRDLSQHLARIEADIDMIVKQHSRLAAQLCAAHTLLSKVQDLERMRSVVFPAVEWLLTRSPS